MWTRRRLFRKTRFDMDETDDWEIPDSDEELGEKGQTWEPLPEQIREMYETLNSGGILTLDWENPGRRSPSVNSNKSDSNDHGVISDEDSKAQPEPNEFDFQDEFLISDHPSKISNRKKGQVTQKRVARLDKVMFDIQRHKKLDEMEQKESIQFANNSSSAKTSETPSDVNQ